MIFYRGDVVLLEILMKSGAQLNKQTDLGKTALHFSVSNLNTDCMRLLIQRGCDLNLQVTSHILTFFTCD